MERGGAGGGLARRMLESGSLQRVPRAPAAFHGGETGVVARKDLKVT